MITELSPNQIFVYGSNLLGDNIGGAALQAKQTFGAEDGIGEGLSGQCYAFPTLNEEFRQRSRFDLIESRKKLYSTARALQEKPFLLTPVGTGIAGYSTDQIESLFRDLPSNIEKVGWEEL